MMEKAQWRAASWQGNAQELLAHISVDQETERENQPRFQYSLQGHIPSDLRLATISQCQLQAIDFQHCMLGLEGFPGW